MCFIIYCICVYYYDYLYVCYMLDIGERAIELMFSVYCHTDENKDYLSIYLSIIHRHTQRPICPDSEPCWESLDLCEKCWVPCRTHKRNRLDEHWPNLQTAETVHLRRFDNPGMAEH